MTKELTINGNKFFASSVLSERFSYTSDYLSKLAREGKIDATRVGRQWFINETSLEHFSLLTKVEKAKRGEELRAQRKVERGLHLRTKKVVENKKYQEVDALAQSLAVVACGVLVGMLGFAAYLID